MDGVLEVQLGGNAAGIASKTYTAVLGQLTHALEDIDRVAEPGRVQRPIWNVTHTSWDQTNGAIVRLAPYVKSMKRTSEDLYRPSTELWGGVKQLGKTPEIPEYFTEGIVHRITEVRQQIGRQGSGLESVSLVPMRSDRPKPALISETVERNATQAVETASLAWGSLTGRLDLISARGKNKQIGLLTDYGPPVMCTVEALEETDYFSAFDRRVTVSGLLRRNARGQAVRLDVESLEVLEDQPRQSALSLLGALPGLGGSLSAVEFIRGRRNGGE